MKIVKDFPPQEYLARILVHSPGYERLKPYTTIGDTLYCPDKSDPPMHKLVHETVHSERQLAYPGGVSAYVDRYLSEPQFRIDEEVEAFAVEANFIEDQKGRGPFLSHCLHAGQSLMLPFYALAEAPEKTFARQIQERAAVLRSSTAE